MSSELNDGEFIVEFVSGGPKSYAYRTSLGRTSVTAKGITLNSKNADIVTFETFKAMVFDKGPKSVYVTDPRKFVRNPIQATIESVPYSKQFKIVYTKRRLMPDGIHTLPYGYRVKIR
jgi:hypothetical protein